MDGPELEKIVEQMQEQEFDDQVHKGFRLWLTSMPCDHFPVPVLQVSVKLTNEPPKGIRSNIQRTFQMYEPEFEKGVINLKHLRSWRRLFFSLAMFHAVIQDGNLVLSDGTFVYVSCRDVTFIPPSSFSFLFPFHFDSMASTILILTQQPKFCEFS